MSNSVGLTAAGHQAIAGIRSAERMASRAASVVAVQSARADYFGPAASVSVSSAGKEAAQNGAPPPPPPPEAQPSQAGDLPTALVDLGVARALQRANVAVLRTEDDMSRELTKLVDHKA